MSTGFGGMRPRPGTPLVVVGRFNSLLALGRVDVDGAYVNA